MCVVCAMGLESVMSLVKTSCMLCFLVAWLLSACSTEYYLHVLVLQHLDSVVDVSFGHRRQHLKLYTQIVCLLA